MSPLTALTNSPAFSLHSRLSLSQTAMIKNTTPRANSIGNRRGLCSNCCNNDFSFLFIVTSALICGKVMKNRKYLILLFVNFNKQISKWVSPGREQWALKTAIVCAEYAVSSSWKCRILVLEVPLRQLVDLGHQLWWRRSPNEVTRVTERGGQGRPPTLLTGIVDFPLGTVELQRGINSFTIVLAASSGALLSPRRRRTSA